MNSFEEGYRFFRNNTGDVLAAYAGESFADAREAYVNKVEIEIDALEECVNSFCDSRTPVKQLKGDIAEYWQAGTFNVDAAINESEHRAYIDRSHQFGSADISTNYGDEFGLKYYANGEHSARQQAISVFERFKEYQSRGGKDSLEKYLLDRHYTSEDVLNDPVYQGQIRVIPTDQLEEATKWLKKMIATESVRRPEQVKRYQETLDLLTDRLIDNEGNESIPLSRLDAEKLAGLAKEGKFNPEDFGVTAPEMLNIELVMKESLNAGLSAAIISLVLRVGPEVFKSIDYLIKNGEIDKEQFKSFGFEAMTGFSESFIRGSVAAAIMTCCKTGIFGEALKKLTPGMIGSIVAITMSTVKNSYQVAIGKKSRAELSDELIKSLFIATSAFVGGYTGKVILHKLPVLGYLIGSFVGSIVGTFVYEAGYKATLSFCTETGITLFGLVDQNYVLPDDIIREIGLQTFEYEKIELEQFTPDTFSFETFEPETFEPDNIGISFLRRGVIGVRKIGYI